MGESLGDLAKQGAITISTGPFGSALHAHDYQPIGVPVIPTEAIEPGRLRHDKIVRITEEKARELARHRLKPGDIVFARRGAQACGLSAPVTEEDGEMIAGTGVITLQILDRQKIDPGFLACAVGAPDSILWLKHHAVGATMPNLNSSVILSLPIRLPDLKTQRAIAHILGTLDHKIELNRRMNETLEAMARAIFKSWFVDFDPVRAKAEGRDPGLPKHIVDLFPDRFEYCELGEMPAGWEVGSILKQASLLSGGTPKTDRKDYWDGDILWASAKDVSQCSQTFLIETERTITESGLEESATQLIPPFCTVVVARGATTGRMVLFGREMAMNQTCYALASITDAPSALYCRLRREMEDLVHAAHGSVFDTITTSTFANSRVVLPPVALLKAFDQSVFSIFQRILRNTEEAQVLAVLRDTLLPKLISGERRVKDAERLIGKVS